MKIALYIAFQNKSSIDCCKEIIDLISDNNQLIVDSKLKNEIDKNIRLLQRQGPQIASFFFN